MNKPQKTVLTATAFLCTAMIAVVALTRPQPAPVPTGEVPAYETEAVKGVPKAADAAYYGTMEIPLTVGTCKVALDAAPRIDGDALNVYFTNAADNTVGLKLVIFNDANEVIGESGVLKQGEYVKSVKLSEGVEKGQQLDIKILTYEEETFYSMGSARATLIMR